VDSQSPAAFEFFGFIVLMLFKTDLFLWLPLTSTLYQQEETEGEWLGAGYFDPPNRLSGHVLGKEHFSPSKTGKADQRGKSRG
jgi:hypothetical protein